MRAICVAKILDNTQSIICAFCLASDAPRSPYNRSCKPWSGYMAEMQRRFTKDLGIPCAGFDGDQADPRNFNAAQYETRVQGLVEAMEANKQAKEADPQ